MLLKLPEGQRGFTTVTLMGVLMVGGLLVLPASPPWTRTSACRASDQDSKQAYAAAEAGLQWYLNRLGRDNSYYLAATNPPAPNATEVAPVNQKWTRRGAVQVAQAARRAGQVRGRADPGAGLRACSHHRPVLDGRPRAATCACAISGPLARRDAHDPGHAAAPELHRLHLLHALRDARPGRVLDDPATTATANARTPAPSARSYPARRSSSRRNDVILGPDAHQRQHPRLRQRPVRAQPARHDRDQRPDAVRVGGQLRRQPELPGHARHPAGQLEMPPSNAELQTLAAAEPTYASRAGPRSSSTARR